MQQWGSNPPVEFRLLLAYGFACAGPADFALFELETIDPKSIEKLEWRLAHQTGKGVFYSLQGWNRLAATEFEEVAKVAGQTNEGFDGQAMAALVHGLAAYQALERKDLVAVDAEIAASLRAWPNNPISVYLTGERLAANGEWEKAAESFEASVAGTKDEWLAQRLAARARALRDGKGTAKHLVLDAPLIIEIGIRMMSEKLGKSAQEQLAPIMLQMRKLSGQLLPKTNS
jgi:hypothetical protein